MREKQISFSPDTTGVMSGSKVKRERFWKNQTMSDGKTKIEPIEESIGYETKRTKTATSDKKSPHMNFSLLYITERKKERDDECTNNKI